MALQGCCGTNTKDKEEEKPLLTCSNAPNYAASVEDAMGEKMLGGRHKFDATDKDQELADVVLVFPIDKKDEIWAKRRDLLLRLQRAGLNFKMMKSIAGDEIFVMIGNIPDARLMEAAEAQQLEVRLKPAWKIPYANFTVSRKDDFVKCQNDASFFSSRDRHTLIMGVIEGDSYRLWSTVNDMKVTGTPGNILHFKHPNCGVNIDNLRSCDVILAIFATHSEEANKFLMSNWVWKPWRPQPLEKVNEYFNSKIALYFGFVGYYTGWLLLAAIVGLSAGLYTIFFSKSLDNLVVAGYSIAMACWGTIFLEFWKRYNSELAYRWSTLKLEDEAKERADFAMGCGDIKKRGFYNTKGTFVPFDEDIQPPNYPSIYKFFIGGQHEEFVKGEEALMQEHGQHLPQAQAMSKFEPEAAPFMPAANRRCRSYCTNTISLVVVAALCVALTAFLVMRLCFMQKFTVRWGGLMAAGIQSACIVSFNFIYRKCAVLMVDFENYRTDQEWENALVRRVFLFQFINSYFTLFYVAFAKGRVGTIFGYDDTCKDAHGNDAPNCMYELSYLLITTLSMVQLGSTLFEVVFPYVYYQVQLQQERVKVWARQRGKPHQEKFVVGRMEHERNLTPGDPADMFIDYNKMIIQFGYISMFCAAFPFAPLLGILNNFIEMRSDGWKRLVATQRDCPTQRAETIGEWFNILQIMSVIAVTSNVGMICFTSDAVQTALDLTEYQTVWMFVVLEHVVLIVKLLIMVEIPDVPLWVERRTARDAFQAHSRQALIDGKQ